MDDMRAEWDKHDGEGKLLDASDKAGNLVDGVGDKVRVKAASGRRRKGSARS